MAISGFQNRWWLAIRGVLSLIFGIVLLVWPGISLAVMVAIFGAFAFIYGIVALIDGITHRNETNRWVWLVVAGVIGIAIGLITLFWPGITVLLLVYYIAAWAILTGISEIAAAITFGAEVRGEWVWVLAGIISIIFGAYLFLFPGAGALSLIIVIGAYAIVYGILGIIEALFPARRMTRV